MTSSDSEHSDSLDIASGILRLPPELIAEILIYLKDDQASLSVCSLISRIWHIESRRTFFHKLTFEADDIIHHQLRPFTRHSIGTELFVREFHLHSPYNNIGVSTDVSVRLSALAPILVRFPSIEVVRICFTSWDIHPSPFRFWEYLLPRPSISLPSVKKVIISQSYWVPRTSPRTLYALLRWFPALEEVEVLKGISPQSLIPNDLPLLQPYFQLLVERPSSITATRITVPKSNPLGFFVATSLAATALHTLAIDIRTNADLKSVRRILLDIGARLQHLKIRVPPQWQMYDKADKKTIYSGLDFSVCTNLQALTVHVALSNRLNSDSLLTHLWNHTLQVLCSFLSSASDTLSNIAITVHSGQTINPAQTQDRFLDNIFRRSCNQLKEALAPELEGADQHTRVELKMGGLGPQFVPRMSANFEPYLRKFQRQDLLHVSVFGSNNP